MRPRLWGGGLVALFVVVVSLAPGARARNPNDLQAGTPPAVSCDPELGKMEIEVEQTVWGSVIRLTARDPAFVGDVHEFARQLVRCRDRLQQGSATGR